MILCCSDDLALVRHFFFWSIIVRRRRCRRHALRWLFRSLLVRHDGCVFGWVVLTIQGFRRKDEKKKVTNEGGIRDGSKELEYGSKAAGG